MLHWHERGPRSAAPLYSSTAPYYLVVHSDTGISGLHVWWALTHMQRIGSYTQL